MTHTAGRGMQLEDFKFIYWMEWAHRMWGRALGLVFVVPAAWFVARGAVRGPLAGRLGLLAAMGATQGLVGWWMVRSGLQVGASSSAVWACSLTHWQHVPKLCKAIQCCASLDSPDAYECRCRQPVQIMVSPTPRGVQASGGQHHAHAPFCTACNTFLCCISLG